MNLKQNIVSIIAIIAIAAMVIVALKAGYNTAILSLALSLIGGIAGYEIGKKKR